MVVNTKEDLYSDIKLRKNHCGNSTIMPVDCSLVQSQFFMLCINKNITKLSSYLYLKRFTLYKNSQVLLTLHYVVYAVLI